MRGFCALTEEAVLFFFRLNYCILEVHSVFFIRTSTFEAEAERSFIFLRFEAENVLKMFLNYIYSTCISVNSMRT